MTKKPLATVQKATIKIDPDFKELIPPLSDDAFAILEQNILKDGCTSPLVVWKEKKLLVDGHNRFTICEKHNLHYKIEERSFKSRDEVIDWIIDQQIGRRNLSPNWMKYFMGKEYLSQKRQGTRSDLTSAQNETKSSSLTADVIAKKRNTSAATVKRAGKFSQCVDEIVAKHGKQYRDKLLNKDIDLKQTDLDRFIGLNDWRQTRVLQILDSGDEITFDKAFHKFKLATYRRPAGMGDEEADEEELPSICKKGDVWHLAGGVHRVGCLDATDPRSYTRLMGSYRAAMVFTDPPYNADYNYKGENIANDKLPAEQFYELLYQSISNMMTFCDGSFYICMGSTEIHTLKRAFEQAGGHFGDFLIWVKNKPTMGWTNFLRKYEVILYGKRQGIAPYFTPLRTETNVWDVATNPKNEWHIAQKPIELIERAIELSSEKRGDIVLDPFAGSGSTLIACHRKVVRGFVMDSEPHRCDSMIRRFIQETEFAYMPMVRRIGRTKRNSLRDLTRNDKALRLWFRREREKYGYEK